MRGVEAPIGVRTGLLKRIALMIKSGPLLADQGDSAFLDEPDRLIAEGVLDKRPGWPAVSISGTAWY